MTILGIRPGPPPIAHRPTDGPCPASDGGVDRCVSDADCGGQFAICACGAGDDGGNVCASAFCHSDADCGRGGYCSPSHELFSCSSGQVSRELDGYFCHTAQDACSNDSDCAAGQVCSAPPEVSVAPWFCMSSVCNG